MPGAFVPAKGGAEEVLSGTQKDKKKEGMGKGNPKNKE
jgi:hypothetical protein